MGLCYSNQLKLGLKVIYNNEPYTIIFNEFIKPGKGQAFVRIKLKNLLNGKLIEKTCKPMDCFKLANISEILASYIFTDGKMWAFMNKKNFEQIFVEERIVISVLPWLLVQHDYVIKLWNEKPISIVYSNNFIELRVIKTTSVKKLDALCSNSKLGTLNTGIVVKVPNFIKIGQFIKIDTRTGEYVSKVKES